LYRNPLALGIPGGTEPSSPPQFHLVDELQRITGVDLTRIDGIDVSRSKTEAHMVRTEPCAESRRQFPGGDLVVEHRG
jgi:hypothetical protein